MEQNLDADIYSREEKRGIEKVSVWMLDMVLYCVESKWEKFLLFYLGASLMGFND